MSVDTQFPLGARLPESEHAVCSSLPTMADVRGYEEKDPRVLSVLRSGYPRFVRHHLVERLLVAIAADLGREPVNAHLVRGARAAAELVAWCGTPPELQVADAGDGLVYIEAGSDAELAARVSDFIRHTGCAAGSREAEARLLERGLLDQPFAEARATGNPEAAVAGHLGSACGCGPDRVLLCSSGMNAFYAAFKAARRIQQARGRRFWIQLGWLYLDTGRILERFLGPGDRFERVLGEFDWAAFEALLEAAGDQLAGVVLEAPGNPLVRTCPLPAVAEAVRRRGGLTIVDPTIASVYQADVLPHCDLLVTSLTKYAAHEGDVMSGAVVVNPESPFSGDLMLGLPGEQVAPYAGDLARLAAQVPTAQAFADRVGPATAEIAGWLEGRCGVREVFWSGAAPTRDNYLEIARTPESWGAVITLSLDGPIERFYDRLACAKGPSFGTRFTLVCPYLYLAHYDMVTDAGGRAALRAVGLDPDLVRISIGIEPVEELKALLTEALD